MVPQGVHSTAWRLGDVLRIVHRAGPRGVSVGEVADASKMTGRYASNVLSKLADRGQIVRLGRGRYAAVGVTEEMARDIETLRAQLREEREAHARTREALAAMVDALHAATRAGVVRG